MQLQELEDILWDVQAKFIDKYINTGVSELIFKELSKIRNCIYDCARAIKDHINGNKNIEDVKDLDKEFTTLISWLQNNYPEYYQHKEHIIFNNIPEKICHLVYNRLYTLKLEGLDYANLTLAQILQIKDEHKVGSGNILIDIVIRVWTMTKSFSSETADAIIDLLPEIISKFNSLQKAKPLAIEDIQYISPFYPGIAFYPLSRNCPQESAKENITAFLYNKQIFIEIYVRNIYEKFNSPESYNFWQDLINNNYNNNEYMIELVSKLDEDIFMSAYQEFYHDSLEERIKFSLTLARYIYNSCYQYDKHFDFVTKLMLINMNNNHTVYFGQETITDNEEFIPKIREILSLPNTPEANHQFDEFLQGISVVPRNKKALRL